MIAVAVPLTFSVLFVSFKSLHFIVLAVISLFAIIAVMPVFRRHESLWMFVLSAVIFLPENLMAVYYFILEDLYGVVLNEIMGFVAFCILFSAEQIILGVATRILWRRQCRLNLDF